MGKLDETQNFLDLYLHAIGRDEVPPLYHLWAGLALLAACVADRVWVEKFRGAKLAPNLYVILVGPSGLGKGVAIDQATKFVRDLPRVNLYRGKSTAAHIVDRLGKPFRRPDGKRILSNPKLFLVTPEIGMSVGSGPLAEDFVKLMTDLYTGSPDPITVGTRMHGEVIIQAPCVSWLAGTTKEWLIRSVPRDAIEGGFFGRSVVVGADYDHSKRFVRPQYPADEPDVTAHLRARVRALAHLGGEMMLTAEAREFEEYWYQQREPPEDDLLLPVWKRQHDLLLKLAMLLCLADGGAGVISRQHVVWAQKLAVQALKAMPDVQSAAATTPDTAATHAARELLRRNGRLQHSTLLRMVFSRGVNATQLREAVAGLIEAKQVTREPGPRGGWVYQWVKRGGG